MLQLSFSLAGWSNSVFYSYRYLQIRVRLPTFCGCKSVSRTDYSSKIFSLMLKRWYLSLIFPKTGFKVWCSWPSPKVWASITIWCFLSTVATPILLPLGAALYRSFTGCHLSRLIIGNITFYFFWPFSLPICGPWMALMPILQELK